jgi:predicted nucleic acid-binding protein
MPAAVLVDAGALIALLDRSDAGHARVVAALASVADPLVTAWPALTEAMHLLRHVGRGTDLLFDMIDDGAVELWDLDRGDLRRMKQLMQKYRDLPMDFADAALVRLAEREGWNRILTLDRHFEIYRLTGRSLFHLLVAPHVG